MTRKGTFGWPTAKAVSYTHLLIDEAEKKGKGLYIVNNKENGKVDPFMSCYGATMRTEGEGNNCLLYTSTMFLASIGMASANPSTDTFGSNEPNPCLLYTSNNETTVNK